MDNYTRLATLVKTQMKLPLYDVLGDEGNIKLPSTTAIFNMGSASRCPSKKLGLCKAVSQGSNCYAMKAEYLYPTVLPFRNRQEKFWKKVTAESFATQFLLINSTKKNMFNKLRFNESGDFWGQEDVNKAEKIARILKHYGIVCYCYTSREDLDFSKVEALRISGSNFKKEGVVNVFKIVKDWKDKPKGYGKCLMNCRICDRCSRAGLKTIIKNH